RVSGKYQLTNPSNYTQTIPEFGIQIEAGETIEFDQILQLPEKDNIKRLLFNNRTIARDTIYNGYNLTKGEAILEIGDSYAVAEPNLIKKLKTGKLSGLERTKVRIIQPNLQAVPYKAPKQIYDTQEQSFGEVSIIGRLYETKLGAQADPVEYTISVNSPEIIARANTRLAQQGLDPIIDTGEIKIPGQAFKVAFGLDNAPESYKQRQVLLKNFQEFVLQEEEKYFFPITSPEQFKADLDRAEAYFKEVDDVDSLEKLQQARSGDSAVEIKISPSPFKYLDAHKNRFAASLDEDTKAQFLMVLNNRMPAGYARDENGKPVVYIYQRYAERNEDIPSEPLAATLGHELRAPEMANDETNRQADAELFRAGYGQEAKTLRDPGQVAAQLITEAAKEPQQYEVVSLDEYLKQQKLDIKDFGTIVQQSVQSKARTIEKGQPLSRQDDLISRTFIQMPEQEVENILLKAAPTRIPRIQEVQTLMQNIGFNEALARFDFTPTEIQKVKTIVRYQNNLPQAAIIAQTQTIVPLSVPNDVRYEEAVAQLQAQGILAAQIYRVSPIVGAQKRFIQWKTNRRVDLSEIPQGAVILARPETNVKDILHPSDFIARDAVTNLPPAYWQNNFSAREVYKTQRGIRIAFDVQQELANVDINRFDQLAEFVYQGTGKSITVEGVFVTSFGATRLVQTAQGYNSDGSLDYNDTPRFILMINPKDFNDIDSGNLQAFSSILIRGDKAFENVELKEKIRAEKKKMLFGEFLVKLEGFLAKGLNKTRPEDVRIEDYYQSFNQLFDEKPYTFAELEQSVFGLQEGMTATQNISRTRVVSGGEFSRGINDSNTALQPAVVSYQSSVVSRQ
ncbi:MAG: hypothetical protein KC733_08095, partial [Candidatus Omnitrophica bacterium]|nr:hypothetical protein [Candidatus Omnitrophota bacterium]